MNKHESLRNSFNVISKEIPLCNKNISYDRGISNHIRNVSLFKKVKSHIEEQKKVIT